MTKRLKKFFATLLTLSMLMNTMNLTVFADSVRLSGATNDLEDIISRSAGVLDNGNCEITITIDGENGDLTVRTPSNAEEKECTCKVATGSDCTATDSNCEANGCDCLTQDYEYIDRFNDLTIVDHMSKWVKVDKNSIKIWDVNEDTEDTVIYENGKWVDDMKPEGARVNVTESRISWKVKAEGLEEDDAYKMTYSVKANSKVDGFEYGTEYPIYEELLATYRDENGEEVEYEFVMAQAPMISLELIPIGNIGAMASKEAELLDRDDNRYKIELRVPGADAPETHDEVILMVDGSYSMDNEWPAMKEAINTIGKTVLNGSGTTQLTLMAFGMGDNEVLVHVKDAEDLASALGALPGNLLYGRSSTNCEAGFDGVANYINNHDDDLENVHVIFISDGRINTNETPYNFYNWQENSWLKRTAPTIAKYSLDETEDYWGEVYCIKNGLAQPSKAFEAVFGNVDFEAFKAESISDEEALAWAQYVWDDVYDFAGLDREKEYPVSVAERAFVSYDKEHNTHIQEAFYYALWGRGYSNSESRTTEAANELAAMDEVASMYVVDYDGYTSWMDTGITNEKSMFIHSNGIAGLCEALKGALSELAKTPVNDVVVTDYMSKWVNLDQSSIKIVDDSTGKMIYSTTNGWVVEEAKRPTDKEIPVVIELVEADEYDEEDRAVYGNTSGDIYKLTWYVKDGSLLRSDSYHLEYEVTVDTKENGFVYNNDYPANGITTVYYEDANGEEHEEEIEVPNVNAVEPDPATAVKTDELIDRDSNKYKVKITVPGADGEQIHDEVILMVDGSYSLDQEWPAMKDAITGIAKELLNGNGNTQLTLMAFGMGDNEVVTHVKSADEIATFLGELPGTLLYGRSSTNCEAGLTGVGEYIDVHDESLNDVHVIYITDGNINTDETPRAFDTNWKTFATKYGALTVAQIAFEETLLYYNNENRVEPAIPSAFYTVFGNRFDDAVSREEILERAFVNGEVTDEEFLAFADQIWADVYDYSELTPGQEYPVSDAERAFVKYDKENGTFIQDAFYCSTYKSNYVTYNDCWTRTPVAANKLAAKEEVESLYFVDYDGYTSWMDTGVTASNSEYIKANGIANLLESMESMITDLALMPYQDVVITDYMSKWVNLDAATIKVVDDTTNTEIYNSVDGWLIDENRPTAQEVPVIVEKVNPEDYADGGVDVVGNTSGDIYKLTWYVKDGALLRSENYHLEYEVTVDTEESGFEYNKDYPANGDTTLKYTDENGIKHEDPIDVPDVDVPKEDDSTEPDDPTEPDDSTESGDSTQPSEPEQNRPSNREPEGNNEPERGRVLGASDEKEPEIPNGVLGAFDSLEILENMVPLGVLPATGDLSIIWIALSILSALGLAGTSMIERKKRK